MYANEKLTSLKPQNVCKSLKNNNKKKMYQILILIKKNKLTTAKIVINKTKNKLPTHIKLKKKFLIQKNFYYKIHNRLYNKNLLIKDTRLKTTYSIFKNKIILAVKKKFIKSKSLSINLSGLQFLTKTTTLSNKLKKKKYNKLVYTSLLKNIQQKFNKVIGTEQIKVYNKLQKIITRKFSNDMYNKNNQINDNLISTDFLQKTNRLYIKNKMILALKLYKKINTLNYLIKTLKSKKKIKKKKMKKNKKKMIKLHKIAFKKTLYFKKKNSINN